MVLSVPITLEYQYSAVSHKEFRLKGKIIMHVLIIKYYFNTQTMLIIVILLCTNKQEYSTHGLLGCYNKLNA